MVKEVTAMGEYIVPAVIILLILVYAGLVIRRKIRRMKAGQFCDCGCGECPTANKCKKNNN